MARIHLLAFPNVQTTQQYCLDGFCQMTLRIAELMKSLGHHVTLYASEENEAPCDELVPVISKAEQQALVGQNRYQDAEIVAHSPLWQVSNPRTIQAIGQRKQPHDMIFNIGGYAHKPVTDAHPDLMDVEYSIGYVGNYSRYRVFQSQVWQHYCYGAQGVNMVRFYDTVIPGFFDGRTFPKVATPQPYVAYCGRIVPRKGLYMATEAAKLAGVPLKIVGHGDPTFIKQLCTYGEYLGPLNNQDRNQVLANASAVYCPTVYVEPFNCVAVEAQMCGTPVISTDTGGFVETVKQGVTGFRCSSLGEFELATKICMGLTDMKLDRKAIQERAERKYGMATAAAAYGEYIGRLETIWKDGWFTR